MTWMGEPFERASSAAEPAVEPTSMAFGAERLVGLVRAGRLDPVDGDALVGERGLEPALVLDDQAERVVGREVDVEGAALGDDGRPVERLRRLLAAARWRGRCAPQPDEQAVGEEAGRGERRGEDVGRRMDVMRVVPFVSKCDVCVGAVGVAVDAEAGEQRRRGARRARPSPRSRGRAPGTVTTWRMVAPSSPVRRRAGSTRSASWRASSTSWVTSRTVVGAAAWTSSSRSCILQPGQGVERRERLVEQQHATGCGRAPGRATPAGPCRPRPRVAGGRRRPSARPGRAVAATRSPRRRPRGVPRGSPRATLPASVRHGSSRGSWKATAQRGSNRSTDRSSIAPSRCGRSSPPAIRSSVDLPQPLAPRIATTSPGRTDSVMSRTTRCRADPRMPSVLNARWTAANSTAQVVLGGEDAVAWRRLVALDIGDLPANAGGCRANKRDRSPCWTAAPGPARSFALGDATRRPRARALRRGAAGPYTSGRCCRGASWAA